MPWTLLTPPTLHWSCCSLYPESEPPPPLPDEKVLGSRRLHNLLWGPPGMWASSGGVWGGGWGQSSGGGSSSSSGATGGGSQGSGKAGVRVVPVE